MGLHIYRSYLETVWHLDFSRRLGGQTISAAAPIALKMRVSLVIRLISDQHCKSADTIRADLLAYQASGDTTLKGAVQGHSVDGYRYDGINIRMAHRSMLFAQSLQHRNTVGSYSQARH